MKPLALTLALNLGLAALYTLLVLLGSGSMEEGLIGLFFVMCAHAVISLIAGLVVLIVQATRGKSMMVGIGLLITVPLLFVIGLASCFGSFEGI